jgi:hypothetical protein
MKSLILLLIPLLLYSCVTPSRLGIRYKNELVAVTKASDGGNPNISLTVNSLTKQDIPSDVDMLKNIFTSYLNRNAGLADLSAKNPDMKIDMVITPSQKVKRTWILDAMFFYPGFGFIIPYTPWWGDIYLDSKLSVTVPGKISNDFRFYSNVPFTINSYPLYRAGKLLTKKYSVAYDNLFEQVKNYDFNPFAGRVASAEKSQQIIPPENIIAKQTEVIKTVQNVQPVSNDRNIAVVQNEITDPGTVAEKKSDPVQPEPVKPAAAPAPYNFKPVSLEQKINPATKDFSWKNTHQFVFSMSFGLGGGQKINSHVQTSYTNGGPASDEYFLGSYLSYSLFNFSYYHFKAITFHLNLAPVINSEKIDDVEDMTAKSLLMMWRFKTQINILHEELSSDGEFYNGYLGYGIGVNTMKFNRKPNNTVTEVTYNPALGHTISVGAEYFYSGFFGGFIEFNYHIAGMELDNVVEDGIKYTPSTLPSQFSDWKKYNANRWEIMIGMKFPLFNMNQK